VPRSYWDRRRCRRNCIGINEGADRPDRCVDGGDRSDCLQEVWRSVGIPSCRCVQLISTHFIENISRAMGFSRPLRHVFRASLKILGYTAFKTCCKGLGSQTSMRGEGRNKTNLRAYRDPTPERRNVESIIIEEIFSERHSKSFQPGAGSGWMTSMVESRRFEKDSAFGATGFEAVDMKQPVNKISRQTRLRIGLPVSFGNETKGTP
jgi:hypothetical protein